MDGIEPLDPGILNDVADTTSVAIESLNPELLNDIVSALQSAFDPLYVAICILVMLNIAILGVLIWKR